MATKKIPVNELSRIFAILQDPLRLRLFMLLVALGGSGRKFCVSDLAEKLGSSLSNTSHQLRKLELAGMVDRLRAGRRICYQFRKTPFNTKLYSFLKSIINLS